ncbi:putative ubiquitin-conjugating enzyme E2 38 [Iris pallida]|uniref:E2 ubiquitin-conjugating enzyme n=1 Tax=Iris pallida TaxID=29817 RepID=A0AAX6H469_IRIPA|nr:putative ubiquitin-conjugating enzyme E2 38 [Iris pallida]
MEQPPAAADYADPAAKPQFFFDDPDIMELSSSSWSSLNQKRKRTQVVHNEIIDVDKDDDPDEVVFINEVPSNCKNKQPMVLNNAWGNPIKDALSDNHVGSSTIHAPDNVALNILNGPKMVSMDYDFLHGYGNYDNDEYDDNYPEGFEDLADDYNFSLAAKFDDLGLPPAVEAAEPWMQKSAVESPSMYEPKTMITEAINMKYKTFKQFDTVQGGYDHYFSKPEQIKGVKVVKPLKDWPKKIQHKWKLLEKLPEFDDLVLPPAVEATEPWMQKSAVERPSMCEPKTVVTEAINMKYKSFKQFDTVQGDYDHYFSKPEQIQGVNVVQKPSKDWTKTIQHEWKLLEKDLPEMIFVRVYEDRMDLLRAVIVGPAGTPYHDGLFFFDAYFPPNYPHVPPLVHYRSGGLRLNPNLYACGKVCLSLLGTWSGSGCEKWDKSKSTMLQVLVSIQALVLNAKPYFNEPGFAHSAGHPHGEKLSLAYNENTFLLSCKTMLYSLRQPPKHFEDFAAGHFCSKGHAILVACRAYLDGAQVGCLVGEGVQDVDEGDKSCSANLESRSNFSLMNY